MPHPWVRPGATASGVTELQLARADAKFKQAMAVVNQVEVQAAAVQVTGNTWRGEMLANLMKGAEENFAAVRLAPSFTAAMGASMEVARAATATAAASGAKALNSGTFDLVYVPITPCRIVDTRAGGAAVPANTVKTYYYSTANVGDGSCSVTTQIPTKTTGPAAFAANVTVDETGLTGFLAGSFLQIYPAGGSTTTSFTNFGPNQIIANAGVISFNLTNGQFSVVSSAPSQVIIDTYGVFIEPQDTALDCVTTSENTVTIGENLFNRVFAPACPVGYTPVATYCRMGAYTDRLSVTSGSVCGGNSANAASQINASQPCCRVPGR